MGGPETTICSRIVLRARLKYMWMNKTAESSAVRLLPGQLTARLKAGLALLKACRPPWNDPPLRKSAKQARRDCRPAVPGNLSAKARARNREPAHHSVSVSAFAGRALFRPRRAGHARTPAPRPSVASLSLSSTVPALLRAVRAAGRKA